MGSLRVVTGAAGEKPGFCRTETAETIQALLAVTQERAGLAVIHGPSGTGKSAAIEDYERRHHGSVHMIRIRESDGADDSRNWLQPVALLRRFIIVAGGWSDKANLPDLLEAAGDAKRWHGGAMPHLLVVDEAHRATPTTLQVFRDVHELLEIGIAFCGESELMLRFKRHAVRLASLRNRVTGWLSLSITDGDLRARIAHHALPESAFSPLRRVANIAGLHGVQTVIELAAEAAGSEPITRAMVAQAATVITGSKELEL